VTIQLTEQQWADAQQAAETPVRVSDPSQRANFVLVRADVYERFKSLFEEDPVTEQERRAQLQRFGQRAGWDDPAMDVYDDLDPRRRK
jgi:DNA-binding SARP family transcriptional activator